MPLVCLQAHASSVSSLWLVSCLQLMLQRLRHLIRTDNAAKACLTQLHDQGPQLYHFLESWPTDTDWISAVLQLLGALLLSQTSLASTDSVEASCTARKVNMLTHDAFHTVLWAQHLGATFDGV